MAERTNGAASEYAAAVKEVAAELARLVDLRYNMASATMAVTTKERRRGHRC